MKAGICAPSARCTGSWPKNQPVRERRNQRSPSLLHQARAGGHGPQPDLVLGHHPAPGAQTLDVLLPLCLARHLQPLRRGLDGCRSGERRARRDADRGNLSQAKASSPRCSPCNSDRGAPMTSKCTAQLLADLGVTRSLSRPQVSDDNPFSEAQFKTLKYHPGFPGRFEDITAAIAFCRSFFPWYNTEHRHAGSRCSPPMMSIITGHRMCWLSADVPCKPPGPFTMRTLRPRHPETRPASRSRLDQPTRHFHNRRNESVNRNRRCLKVVDRFRASRISHRRAARLRACR